MYAQHVISTAFEEGGPVAYLAPFSIHTKFHEIGTSGFTGLCSLGSLGSFFSCQWIEQQTENNR